MAIIPGIGGGRIERAAPRRRPSDSGWSRFAPSEETPGEARPPNTADVGAVGLAGLLALQTLPEHSAPDRREEREQDAAAERFGQSALRMLSAVQADLLRDDDPAATLRALNAALAAAPSAADPALNALIDAIVLRARVELARRGDAPRTIDVAVP